MLEFVKLVIIICVMLLIYFVYCGRSVVMLLPSDQDIPGSIPALLGEFSLMEKYSTEFTIRHRLQILINSRDKNKVLCIRYLY